MSMISTDQLKSAAGAQHRALFKSTDSALDEARENALLFQARAFIAAGFSVEGYEDEQAEAGG